MVEFNVKYFPNGYQIKNVSEKTEPETRRPDICKYIQVAFYSQ